MFSEKHPAGTQNHPKSLFTFHLGQPETLTDWKSESVTYLPTYQQTQVGARDTCVFKKEKLDTFTKKYKIDRTKVKLKNYLHPHGETCPMASW